MNTLTAHSKPLTDLDRETIKLHFVGRLYERYNIKGCPTKLQQEFKLLVSSRKATKLMDYKEDPGKAQYFVKYRGKKVLFIWHDRFMMAKTALKWG